MVAAALRFEGSLAAVAVHAEVLCHAAATHFAGLMAPGARPGCNAICLSAAKPPQTQLFWHTICILLTHMAAGFTAAWFVSCLLLQS
jgi:hypothetical protein